jgi:hypothetical protein
LKPSANEKWAKPDQPAALIIWSILDILESRQHEAQHIPQWDVACTVNKAKKVPRPVPPPYG